ncbi:TetR/AcrR family transcriptional regulator [Novosphingobium sp. NDB2Meth1]|uniref:TetR/AcrR family transcriptional regulator n=1 Tax=Novosphingobium sp. NDB2Meth1 TaxID=1892847 RepID=UPI0009318F05|nr:TetR/AcrR family transcriptional regulator [Novosphingobium sp. NDB2Meth1]
MPNQRTLTAEPPREDLAARLLEEAEALVRRDGPDGVALRELARACGSSTMAIYTLYGGKPGLMQALYAIGFARLHAYALEVEEREAPLRWMVRQMLAYRRFALDHTGMYRLMFGGEKRFSPTGRHSQFVSLSVPVEDAYPAFAALVDAVGTCLAHHSNTAPAPAEVQDLAFLVWGQMHGLVGLEIAGYADPDDALPRYQSAVRFICASMGADAAAIDAEIAAAG